MKAVVRPRIATSQQHCDVAVMRRCAHTSAVCATAYADQFSFMNNVLWLSLVAYHKRDDVIGVRCSDHPHGASVDWVAGGGVAG